VRLQVDEAASLCIRPRTCVCPVAFGGSVNGAPVSGPPGAIQYGPPFLPWPPQRPPPPGGLRPPGTPGPQRGPPQYGRPHGHAAARIWHAATFRHASHGHANPRIAPTRGELSSHLSLSYTCHLYTIVVRVCHSPKIITIRETGHETNECDNNNNVLFSLSGLFQIRILERHQAVHRDTFAIVAGHARTLF
jgi:hypothetical protein